MSDHTSNDDNSDGGPVGGERLRIARRANDISVRDVAKELHLDEHKVRALEKNEFDVLGAPVFAKGHLRKYAELVGVDKDDVMTDYYQMNRAAGAPPVVGPKRRHSKEQNPTPWIAAGIVVLLLVAITWWWFAFRSPAPVASDQPAGPAPFVATETVDEPETVVPAPVADAPAPESVAREPVADSPPEAIEEPVAEPVSDAAAAPESYAPTPGVPQVDLDLAFTGDCWTEISDGAGRRLYYGLGQEGSIVTISGDAPLGVILGNAQNVDLTVNGRPYPIPQASIRGRLARLTIAAP